MYQVILVNIHLKQYHNNNYLHLMQHLYHMFPLFYQNMSQLCSSINKVINFHSNNIIQFLVLFHLQDNEVFQIINSENLIKFHNKNLFLDHLTIYIYHLVQILYNFYNLMFNNQHLCKLKVYIFIHNHYNNNNKVKYHKLIQLNYLNNQNMFYKMILQ